MPDGPEFTFDEHEFARALDLVEKETGRTAQESINREGLYVVIGGKGFQGAMQLTPKASKAAIRSVNKSQVASFVAHKLRASGLLSGMSKENFAREVAKEIKRRVRAIGYTAYAGWNNAAKAFGGKGLKGITESAKKLSRFGYGKKATTPVNPEATLTNTAPMAEKIGLVPLQKAITNVARDMVEYAMRKIQKTFDKAKP